MRDSLETRYENELIYIRKLGAEFAKDRPKIADRLQLEQETGLSRDPHVERLIEAFAFLAARIRLKLDDQFPELTTALLGTLYPHYLAPIPSMGIANFEVDPERTRLPKGHTIPRHSQLAAPDIDGVGCRFRTCQPLTLWPIEVTAAWYQTTPFGKDILPPPRSRNAKALLRIELTAAAGMTFAELELSRLRFFISGDDPLVHRLYELVFNHVIQGMVRPADSGPESPAVVFENAALEAVGFEPDEGMLPYGNRSFAGYRLLTEYFAFPARFLFFDVTGLEGVRRLKATQRIEILLFLNRTVPNLESQVSAETFRLGCVPIINLYEQEADPIRITQARTEYLVLPDVRHYSSTEVYSVDGVESTNLETSETTRYQPYFAFKHASESAEGRAYWHSTRRASVRKNDTGTDVYLSLVDMAFNPTLPPAEILTLRTTCTNRQLPEKLRQAGGEDWGFQLRAQAPVRRIVPVVGPTAPVRLPADQLGWRLISHLNLNHLSITGEADGADALREILKVYEYTNSRVAAQHIDGITSVGSRRRVARVGGSEGEGFCRGIEVMIEFDEEKYAGSGVYLFACVLERFLAAYATINSVTRLAARLKQREGYFKIWPFRVGAQKTL